MQISKPAIPLCLNTSKTALRALFMLLYCVNAGVKAQSGKQALNYGFTGIYGHLMAHSPIKGGPPKTVVLKIPKQQLLMNIMFTLILLSIL